MALRAEKGIHLGYYDTKGKIFWVYLLEQKRVVRASSIRFVDKKDFDFLKEDEVEAVAVFDK